MPITTIPMATLRFLLLLLLSALFLFSLVLASDDPDTPPPEPDDPPGDPPCTITSPTTGAFFDLRPLIRTSPPHTTDYLSLGHDYPANFTLNICGPVLTPLPSHLHPNTSAFYTLDSEAYSLGTSSSSTLTLRGRKLILSYTDGSPCPASPDTLTKSTTFSLLCSHDHPSTPSISFVTTAANHCAYFFEIRTIHACPTIHPSQSGTTLGPISIFATIGIVAMLVYCVGGCVYQRTVMHARGWRQVPHWQTWGGIGGVLWDLAGFLCVGVMRVFPCFRRRGGGGSASIVGGSGGGGGNPSTRGVRNGFGSTGAFGRRGAGGVVVGSRVGGGREGGAFWGDNDVDDENRLLDQLDEEWGDD